MKTPIYAIDFDGTCVTHEYPEIGEEIGAAPVLKALADSGARLILFTMRSGAELEASEMWFAENMIPLFGVNQNPEQNTWTSSPKPYATTYIDDAALGAPLIFPGNGKRPHIDWKSVAETLGLSL